MADGNSPAWPAYLGLYESGELARRASLARETLADCALCGWSCHIDRSLERGPCRTGMAAGVATAYLHRGEERPLSGGRGSGAIFFSRCDLRCQFCQTYRWNVLGEGRDLQPEQIAALMLGLQAQGADNINLVTPTHVTPQILDALYLAADQGLRLPLVWNSGGYDAPQALSLLDGVVDIYMPDIKYADAALARRLSGVPDYPRISQAAVREMHRQVGDLVLDDTGLARRGLLVRHLVMPGHAGNSTAVLQWLAANLGRNTYISLMDQYRPAYRAIGRKDSLGRAIKQEEYQRVRDIALSLGLTRLDGSLLLD